MILFYGDPHGNFKHISRTVEKEKPAAIILLGDVEASKQLEIELADILNKTDVWFIHGNHDTDQQHYYDNLFNSKLSHKNLHGRVVEIDGVKVAGLGGVFRGEIWHPNTYKNPIYESYDEYESHLNSEVTYKKMSELKRAGNLLKHKSSIFYEDYFNLEYQTADILVTHEAPSCHPYGFSVLDELARKMGVKTVFHGHHHDCLDYSPHFNTMGFKTFGVGYCGVTDMNGLKII